MSPLLCAIGFVQRARKQSLPGGVDSVMLITYKAYQKLPSL